MDIDEDVLAFASRLDDLERNIVLIQADFDLTYPMYCGTIKSAKGGNIMSNINRPWVSSADCLRLYISESFRSTGHFVDTFNEENASVGLSLSRSLVDSWLCGRRQICNSSANLVWHVACVLTRNGSESAVYRCISCLIHGRCSCSVM